MDISDIRRQIDQIDDRLSSDFLRRMELVGQLAEFKVTNNLPITDTERQRQIITRLTMNQDETMAGYTQVLFNTIFDISCSYQSIKFPASGALTRDIVVSLGATPASFPKSATVAAQGIEGSNSQLACQRLFPRPDIMYLNNFEAVFAAVEKGLCQYGVLPIENSLQGSVNAVYDLMKKYHFFIVRSAKINIKHALVAKIGTKMAQIKEIFSHEQAIGQCENFLKTLTGVKVTAVENTAVAARMVSLSKRDDVAAISNSSCASLYGLGIVTEDIQNNDNNYTRFICISKKMEIYPGASKISLMFSLAHRPGTLNGIISRFASLGLNLLKLESRPIAGSDFEFMFYIDFVGSVQSEEVLRVIGHLENDPSSLVFLGNYSEV